MASQERLRWPAGLTFPETAALGREGEPLPVRRLLAGGPGALAALGDLVEAVRLLAECGDGILADAGAGAGAGGPAEDARFPRRAAVLRPARQRGDRLVPAIGDGPQPARDDAHTGDANTDGERAAGARRAAVSAGQRRSSVSATSWAL